MFTLSFPAVPFPAMSFPPSPADANRVGFLASPPTFPTLVSPGHPCLRLSMPSFPPPLTMMPHGNIIDTGKQLKVSLPNPGIPLANIKADVKGNILTISGESKKGLIHNAADSFQSHVSQNSFSHQVMLPVAAQHKPAEIKLDKEKETLWITLNKSTHTKSDDAKKHSKHSH